ncbi:MAG: hypothetical protein ACW97Z_16740 [Candidatus Hodarchaeales archaeon]
MVNLLANRNSNSSRETLSEGIIFSAFEDQGPTNIYNSSPLNEEEAFGMTIKTLTAIGSDSPFQHGEIRCYGPMPTPKDPYLSLGFIFFLKAKSSQDPRIQRHGRMIVLWVITSSATTIKYIGLIKNMIRRSLQQYHVRLDEDLKKRDVFTKIDEKIRLIETGVSLFYVSRAGSIDPIIDPALIAPDTTCILLDDANRQIKALFRSQVSPGKKNELLRQINDFKSKIPQGSLYKVEIITDDVAVQQLSSKYGLSRPDEMGFRFQLHLADIVTFEELDAFFEFHFNPKRHDLISRVLGAIYNKEKLNLFDVAVQTGVSVEFLEEFIQSAITANLIKTAKIEHGFLVCD